MSRAIENHHRSSAAMISRFASDRCDTGAHLLGEATPLYRAYLDWCAETGHQPFKQTAFGWALARSGFAAEKIGGRVYRRGVALRSAHSVV